MDRDTFQLTEPWTDGLRPFEGGLRVSPDGLQLAVQMPDSGGIFDCWLSDVEQPGLRRFIHEASRDCCPNSFTPDSKELLYGLHAAPTLKLYRRRVDGTGKPELLLEEQGSTTDFATNSFTFTADGEQLILTHTRNGRSDLRILPLEAGANGSRATRLLMADARAGRVSPDGRLLLYMSEASGKWEWYVCTIGRDGKLGRALQLTGDGGDMFWRKPVRTDGFRDLIHIHKDLAYRVTISVDPNLGIAGREMIAEAERDVIATDQLPDGRWLAVTKGEDEIDEFTSVAVVLNWTKELRRRLAAAGH